MDFKSIMPAAIKFDLNKTKTKVDLLNSKLDVENYKIIKCMEQRLLDPTMPLEEMPYDVVELITKRDSIRAKIKEYEVEIAKLEAKLNSKSAGETEEDTEQTQQ